MTFSVNRMRNMFFIPQGLEAFKSTPAKAPRSLLGLLASGLQGLPLDGRSLAAGFRPQDLAQAVYGGLQVS